MFLNLIRQNETEHTHIERDRGTLQVCVFRRCFSVGGLTFHFSAPTGRLSGPDVNICLNWVWMTRKQKAEFGQVWQTRRRLIEAQRCVRAPCPRSKFAARVTQDWVTASHKKLHNSGCAILKEYNLTSGDGLLFCSCGTQQLCNRFLGLHLWLEGLFKCLQLLTLR